MEKPASSPKYRCSGRSFLLGLLLGGALGLLLAPQAGAATRKQLLKRVQQQQTQQARLSHEGSQQVKGLVQETRSLLLAKLDLLKQALAAGKQAAQVKHQQLSQAEALEHRKDSTHG